MLADIKRAGYVRGLNEAGYSLAEVVQAGYHLSQLRIAGYQVADFIVWNPDIKASVLRVEDGRVHRC